MADIPTDGQNSQKEKQEIRRKVSSKNGITPGWNKLMKKGHKEGQSKEERAGREGTEVGHRERKKGRKYRQKEQREYTSEKAMKERRKSREKKELYKGMK
ncbi:hypothetical protein XENORESO_021463 [Xenotaenia resolanae]|uniref:Uncharacterized protein n=1 Tax=Xenotaenia resolanae TaxID=208358 RepID=A0ABV0WR19_9TELE